MKSQKVIILGAAGRDFHNFNVYFRNNKAFEVVAFTATQIPGIEGRRYPPRLAGRLYPDGIPILPESELESIIRANEVDLAVLAYSDLAFATVMHLGARVNAAGADFCMMGTRHTLIASSKPVIAVCAVRTGCGKSQTSRFIAHMLRSRGLKVVSVRHPMPYGDLERQTVQRFAKIRDCDKHDCTIEEREEYEAHIQEKGVIYAGVDYGKILKKAEAEADVVIWDGGNNDLPFYKPDLWITVADPLRPGHERAYYPGETNVRGSDVIIIGKTNTAPTADVEKVIASCRELNPKAKIIRVASEVQADKPEVIRGKRVLVIEDGPTLTHGEMTYGAGTVACRAEGALLVDPRPWAVGTISEVYRKYPGIGPILPAMGYSPQQVKDLEQTINAVDCDAVVIATPFDLRRIIQVRKPSVIVTYTHRDVEPDGGLGAVIEAFCKTLPAAR